MFKKLFRMGSKNSKKSKEDSSDKQQVEPDNAQPNKEPEKEEVPPVQTPEDQENKNKENEEKNENVSELPTFNDVPAKYKRRGRRVSVSAECGDGTTDNYVPKIVPKAADVVVRIKDAVSKSFLFSSLSDQQLEQIVAAMEERTVSEGDVVIKEGADGDYFYIIDHGKFDVLKNIDGEEKKVFFYDDTGSFGELALMYNCPRAATVKATSDAVLYAVDRQTFRHIIIVSRAKQARLYESFLAKVPLFENLTSGERSLIADCLVPTEYKDGDVIIKQGDEGDSFYLLESGAAVALQTPKDSDQEVEVGKMVTGQFFGERALIKNEPRAATVKAAGDVKVAKMARDAFERLLGDCRDIMERQIVRYKSAEEILEADKAGETEDPNDGSAETEASS